MLFQLILLGGEIMEKFRATEVWPDDTPEARQKLHEGLQILARIIARKILDDRSLQRKQSEEYDRGSKKVPYENPIPNQEKRLTLTVRETAELLRISRNAVYEALRTGQTPSIKFGRRIIIPYKAVINMLDAAAPGNRFLSK
jgi:excisionase family DNA binding protein